MSQKRSRREYEADLRRQQAPFVLYGTPLPFVDENARDDGSYVPMWKQEVTDERGRKRLHGAFTGGFSAGYFNSVGSKEGWAPSTFVSSRSNRAKDARDAQGQRVEDFMDDEDLREREDSRRISTAEGFTGFGAQNNITSQHALDDLFKPLQDSMGEKLLNKMGWKKGQGIGPRNRRRIDPNDDASEVKEFPPEDSPLLVLVQRHDNKGLGHGNDENIQGNSRSTPRSRSTENGFGDESHGSFGAVIASSKPRKTTKASGIGVGPLNDTGSDDEDPYEIGPKMSYNRVLGGDKKAKKVKSSTNNANPLLKNKPVFMSKKLPTVLTSLRKCHDGRLPLTGFVLADLEGLDTFGAMSLSEEKYKPPEVPENWQPKQSTRPADVDAKSAAISMSLPTTFQEQQTAQSRANILQETPLPSKSVFDFLTPAARDRLAAASGKSNLPPALGQAPPSSTSGAGSRTSQETLQFDYPHVDPTTALTALTRLRKDKDKPYADDLPKQGRYKDFLRFSSDPKPMSERVQPLRDPTHRTNEEHISETNEFATTANLFRPATGFLASRFTSAASTAGVETTSTGTNADAPEADELLRRPNQKPQDPAEEAARMGMFGFATRTTIGFYPTKLLCKRFGVDIPSGE